MMRKLFVLFIGLMAWIPAAMQAEEAGVHRFANYNVRYVNSSNGDTGEKLWANRRKYVVKNITKYDFDIVGMEEVTGNNKDASTGKSQLRDLRDMLTGYADWSVEREGGNYSYNSIFYKTSKYTLLDKGHFYLNEHPETPGEGWNTAIARTCIWVYLRDNASGQDFYFVCTHVNFGENICGIESAKLIGHRIRQLVGQTPMVMVGDFNMSRSSHYEAYRGYASHFYDLALTAPVNQCLPADGPQITATTTQWTPAVNTSSGSEYDYIWYDHMEPLSRHIITDYYPEENRTVNPSDHYPVLGRFRLGSPDHPTRFYATDVASLQQAMKQATQEDTILIQAGTYTLTAPLKPACSLVFSGGWNSDFSQQTGVSTFEGQGFSDPLFYIPQYYNIELQYISVQGTNTTSLTGGGAVYSYGPKVRLIDCVFSSNTATTNGGAVSHKGDSLYLQGCVFSGNTAQVGGALWCEERNRIWMHNCRFEDNSATNAGGAVEAVAFTIMDVQSSAFVRNKASMRGALDVCPATAPSGVHLLNCAFLGNLLSASKGMASVTQRYGGAALWVDVQEPSVPINIGLCTFLGNHLTFNGAASNFVGSAVNVFQGKVCLMDNLILANELTIDGADPKWADIHTNSAVNVWRNTNTLLSSSGEIAGWQEHIVETFGGSLDNGIYRPVIKKDGSYPIYQKHLGDYNLACLPTNQRLCESAFTYDLDGNGVIDGYVKRDMLNRQRGIQSCIGAIEYSGNETPEGTADLTANPSPITGKIIKAGQMLIQRENKTYDIHGRLIR